MRSPVAQTVPLPLEDQRQMTTTANLYQATKPLTRELHDLCQWVEVKEGQPTEGLDVIERELQNLSFMLQLQSASTPTPAESFGEVIHQYTNTLCTTKKQMNLTNSILQDIAVLNEYD